MYNRLKKQHYYGNLCKKDQCLGPMAIPETGLPLKDKIVVIDIDDIETFPSRDEAGGRYRRGVNP